MEERTVKPGEFYRHFKNKLYQIVAVATHSETREKYVVYQALYDDFQVYIRPYDMFLSEVDHVKYPQVAQKYRFEKVNLSAPTPVKNNETPEDTPNENITEKAAGPNPYLLEFLDKPTCSEKEEYIRSIRMKLTDRLINDICAAMDFNIAEGNIDQRTADLISALSTRARFECKRLR